MHRLVPILLSLMLLVVPAVIAAQSVQDTEQLRAAALQEVKSLDAAMIKFYRQGRYEKAILQARKALEIRERIFGPEHVDVGQSLNNLAALYNFAGRFSESERLSKRAIKIGEIHLGTEAPQLASWICNLASLYTTTEKFVEAEDLYKRALKIEQTALGPEHPQVAITLGNLGQLYEKLARYTEAETLFKEALKITIKVRGQEHPDVATSLSNLAGIYRTTGRYAEAEPLLKKAIEINEKTLSPEHPSVAACLNNLAVSYILTARNEEAELLLKRALEILKKSIGFEHPNVAACMHQLAVLYESIGKSAEAELFCKKALAIREKTLGPKHPSVAESLNALACLYGSDERYTEAEALLKKALTIHEKALGPEHPATATSINNLAALYNATGRYAEAKPLLKRALKIASQAGKPELLYNVQRNYSDFLSKQGKPEAAIFLAKQAVNTIQTLRSNVAALGKETLQSFTGTVEDHYKDLANLLIAQGRLAEAQQVLGMLKEEEYFQFVRRDAGTAPDLQTTATFTSTEQPWHLRYEELSDKAARLGKELRELREKDAKGVLTEAEQNRFTALLDEDAQFSETFDSFLTDMVTALQQEADKLKDSADRDKRLAEISQRNLPGTTALMQTLDALGDGAVLLSYLMVEERLHIILTTPDTQLARHSDISEADLNAKIFRWREQLINTHIDPRPLGQELYQLLIAPVAEDLRTAGARTLMLSLDGALRYLPFAALHDGSQYLASSYRTVMYAEVAKDKVALPAKPSWKVAALGVSEQVRDDFTPLTAVPAELSGIVLHGEKGVIPGEIHLNDEFTETTLRQSAARNSVIHIASHFHFQPGTEMDSSLLLGDGTLLSLAEVKKGPYFRRAELLTLSACQTAMGSRGKGSEIEGFGAVAMNGGAKAVIATLWSVADNSTATLMQDFYRLHEQNHLIKAEALRQAQLHLQGQNATALDDQTNRGTPMRTGKPTPQAPAFTASAEAPHAHPFYWAPFILMGNWK